MGRPRIMLDVRIFHNAKFGALANRHKLGFIYLLCDAKQQDREGMFPSRQGFLLGAGPFRDGAPEWLERGLIHYAPGLCPKCAKYYGEVTEGSVVVHDWSDYQMSRTTEWRNKSETLRETEVKPLRARARSSASVSLSESLPPEGVQGEPDPADVYWSLTGRYPTDKVLSWVDDLAAKYGSAETIRALAGAHQQDGHTNTLLGRAQDVLRAEARALDRKEQEDERRRLREKRAVPRVAVDRDAVNAEIRRLMQPGAAA